MANGFPILVVDDDVVSRSLIERYLKKADFEVSSAGNGREALALMDRQFFPIVLTDWMMPEMDGPELCRMIRNRETEGYVFIILITARDSKTDIVSGLEAGADDYLTKPIHSAELLARINTGIRILRLEQSLLNANKEIRLLSITDNLTGCFNRAYLNERLPQEFSRSRRYKHSLSLIIGDIDHFKKINDTYGHQAGDMVLKSVGGCLVEQVRSQVDWVVRYGGEEFLVILPETDCTGASILSERLRAAVSNLKIEHQDQKLRVTASFGAASAKISELNITMDQLIKRADEQLYQSKNDGRDCVNVVDVNTC